MDLPKFVADVMLSYGRPMPEAVFLKAWIKQLEAFPEVVIRQAMGEYMAKEDVRPPTPNAIVNRCKLLDGRPGSEEAWAMSLRTQDEAQTVVWTMEMAEAFHQCLPMVLARELVSARMAFKEVYEKLVSRARADGVAAVWRVVPGSDKGLLAQVTKKAVAAGLIGSQHEVIALPSAQPDVLLLEGGNADMQSGYEPNIKRLRELLGTIEPMHEKIERINRQRREAEKRRKDAFAEATENYLRRNGEV